jgi:DNA-directed RNA polymerase subunit RPC12/RpoP
LHLKTEPVRTNSKCPYCVNHILTSANNLQAVNPILAKQWHPTKNGELLPQHIFPNSMKKIWWICEFGHEWETTVNNRNSKNQGCPYCSGRVLTPDKTLDNVHPKISKLWHPTKNGELKSINVSSGSKKNVWWLCSYCNHEYQRIVSNQTKNDRKNKCPNCKKLIIDTEN